MVVAILPPHISYLSIKIKADKYLVRAKSQILSIKNNNFKFSFFDELVDQNIGQHYNKRAISESINIGYHNGKDYTKYKSLSVGDINFVETNLCIFNPIFRESLSFLTQVNYCNPKKVIISSKDPFHKLFIEISQQLSLDIILVDEFGKIDNKETELVKSIYKQWDNFEWHLPIKFRLGDANDRFP